MEASIKVLTERIDILEETQNEKNFILTKMQEDINTLKNEQSQMNKDVHDIKNNVNMILVYLLGNKSLPEDKGIFGEIGVLKTSVKKLWSFVDKAKWVAVGYILFSVVNKMNVGKIIEAFSLIIK